jgi:hypothetical protein
MSAHPHSFGSVGPHELSDAAQEAQKHCRAVVAEFLRRNNIELPALLQPETQANNIAFPAAKVGAAALAGSVDAREFSASV